MQFIHTIDKVLSGKKMLTSRIVKGQPDGISARGEMLQYPRGIASVMRGDGIKWHVKWQVGKTYAVQPGRGLASKGRIQLLTIREYDVRDITADEAQREGFENELEFWRVWCGMHDRRAFNCVYLPIRNEVEAARWYLKRRLDNVDARYAAWQLGFKLITE